MFKEKFSTDKISGIIAKDFVTHTLDFLEKIKFVLEKGYLVPYGGGYFGLSVHGSFQFIVKHIYISLVFPIDIIYRTESIPTVYVGVFEHQILDVDNKKVDVGVHGLMWEAEIRVKRLDVRDAIGIVVHDESVKELARKISEKYRIPIIKKLPKTELAEKLQAFVKFTNFFRSDGYVSRYLNECMTPEEKSEFWNIVLKHLPERDQYWFYNSKIIKELTKTFADKHPDLFEPMLKVRKMLLDIVTDYHRFVLKLFDLDPVETFEALLNYWHQDYKWLISYSVTSELLRRFKLKRKL